MIHPTARIKVDELVIGEGTIVRAHAEIYGKRVVLGRESFIDEYAVIGGGSASDGELVTGDWFHLGMFAQVNTARPVHIGHEVGVGIGSRIFTHGAYLSEYDGFPVNFDGVTIGNRVWLPNAIVLPGSSIGDDVVVAAGSVVSGIIPAGSLAGGSPAKVLRANAYPDVPADRIGLLTRICREVGAEATIANAGVVLNETAFHVRDRVIIGKVTDESERVRNQLRRHGIRFRYSPVGGVYEAWT